MAAETILVTGASGFVGGHLLPALRSALPAARIVGTGSGLVELDITQNAAVRRLVAELRPDVCIHLAGIAALGTALADPARAWAVNLHGTLNLADAMQEFAPRGRLMFISSSECYGASFKSGQKLDEAAPLAPLNLYAATKAAADLALGARGGLGLRVLRLRPTNHTGPGQSEDFVVPAFAGQIARIEAGLAPPEILVGALQPARDFLDIRDVCAAYAACVRHDADLPDDTILNIASGRAVPIGTILDLLLARTKCHITIRQDPARLRPVDIPTACCDASKALRLLGWRPEFTLEDMLDSVLGFARRKQALLF